MAKPGRKAKKQAEAQPKRTYTKRENKVLTTQEELYELDKMCGAFEKMNDDARKRVMNYLLHRYSEYLPETLYLTDKK